MKNILNTIVLLEIISVMCVRHTASFKKNYRGRPITKLFNTPQKKYNDGETPDRRAAVADVASPRPREVGGACRIQVLASARTQETVGGSNGAKRSEFRRRCPLVGAKSSSMHYILAKMQKLRNRHYSALGALYLKVKVSKMEI